MFADRTDQQYDVRRRLSLDLLLNSHAANQVAKINFIIAED